MDQLDLTKKQKSAIRSLGIAFRKCKEANIEFHNCYGSLYPYNRDTVEGVDDDKDDDLIRCFELSYVNQHGYQLDSWADDPHWVHIRGDKEE